MIFRILRKIKKTYKDSVLKKIYSMRVKAQSASFGEVIKVNGPSYVTKNTILGNNINFNGMKINGGAKVSIGNNFHSGEECLIITDVHNYDYGEAVPYDNTYIKKDVVIEDNVWIGTRVIILGGVTIGEGAIVQAGSVVVGNIPRYAIYGGHPAKFIKNRDIEHYEKLKKEKKFH
jgi:chloramphenicol O-acetyltransferase type B